ncbi:HSP90 family protein [Spiractinospora alimapuensis]|uniref:HSP90 family protein n=1 Tax=Spiractinospora alimapuensis TaxID=2820884 RepID=UPI001EEBB3B6|nr:HSP90 family protein [Spiractinospora alimapuensis]QVQ53982.1 HSP90 family protein [Spiractinospora alimapuensis]
MTERAFQVDLRGVVDLLSRHLYTSPRVYVRELLQNAVDACGARAPLDPDTAPSVSVEPWESTGDGTLRVHDNGIGLTETEVHELLATIGRSSKRDELGFARQEFLGQFGIGLLSCFLVADEIRVRTRSAHGGPTVAWTGFADGRYRVERAEEQRSEPGTTVTLVPRPGMRDWLAGDTVTRLATWYGGLLPIPVTVAGQVVSAGELPWRTRHSTPERRGAALSSYAERLFGFEPFDVIHLHVPEAGLSGLAFVLPTSANPAQRAGHRVYLRRMLVADGVEKLLPDWAFFVRCVVDTSELRPTASREEVYDDDLLARTREALGSQIRDWLVRLASTDPRRLRRFLTVHHLGVKALALHDTEMLRIVERWWPMETNEGPVTLAEFRRTHPVIRYTTTADGFRELAAVAHAQGIGVVNGGYAYDIDIMRRLSALDRALEVRPLEPSELTTRFAAPDAEEERRLGPLLSAATRVLEPLGCDPLPRAFDPSSLPALYLVSRQAIQAEEMRAARESADDLWSAVLSSVGSADTSPEPRRPQLVLNLNSPVLRRMIDLPSADLVGLAVQALYGQALLHGHHPLRSQDSALLNQSFLGLLDWAMPPGGKP